MNTSPREGAFEVGQLVRALHVEKDEALRAARQRILELVHVASVGAAADEL